MMLIKDLDIDVEINEEEDEYYVITFSCDVIIKRDKKYYKVPVKIRSNRSDMIETVEYGLCHCHDVDVNWKVIEEGPLKTEEIEL